MTTYDITVTRDGRWWMIDLPAVDGLTQARTLDEVEPMARSYVMALLDVAPSAVEINVTAIIVNGRDLLPEQAEIARLKALAESAEHDATARARTLAHDLADDVTLKDIGRLFGVSRQRVGQLIAS